MINENKASRYVFYAIGEIVLVVIGILIALQINNWNEFKKQEIDEQDFYEGIKNDLTQDKEFIELVNKNIEPKINAYSFLNNQNHEFYKQNRTTIDSLLWIYFTSQRTFYPISGSFESAVAGNEINGFRNKELTGKIIKLYNSTYSRVIDNGEILDDRWGYLSKKYSHNRRIGHFRELDEQEIVEIVDEIYHHYAQIQWYKEILKSTTLEINELLEEINKSH